MRPFPAAHQQITASEHNYISLPFVMQHY